MISNFVLLLVGLGWLLTIIFVILYYSKYNYKRDKEMKDDK
jgi:hypothetical protein